MSYVQNYGALSALPVAEIPIWPKSEDNTVAMLTEHIEKTVFTFTGHTFTPSSTSNSSMVPMRSRKHPYNPFLGQGRSSTPKCGMVPRVAPSIQRCCALWKEESQVDKNKQEKVCIKA